MNIFGGITNRLHSANSLLIFNQVELKQLLQQIQKSTIKFCVPSFLSTTSPPVCRQNEVLWREVVLLRQNHTQQQKVMNKVSLCGKC